MARALYAVLLCMMAPLFMAPSWANGISLGDLAGRTIELPAPARRIVFSDVADFMALALLTDDPVALTVGWAAPQKLDTGQREAYRRRFPDIDTITVVGGLTPDTFSAEQTLALKPDLVVLGYGFNADSPIVRQLEAAKTPVLLLTETLPAARKLWDIAPRLSLLGKAIGAEARAQDYIAFHQAHIAEISRRIEASRIERPRVLLEFVTGDLTCCQLAGGKTTSSSFVDLAGGISLADIITHANYAEGSLEYVISSRPEVFIGLGGDDGAFYGLKLGPGVTEGQARRSLESMADRTGFAALPAIATRRMHSIWLPLLAGPYNVLAAEVTAKWIHPEIFSDIDPDRTRREINERFLSVPLEGALWVGLGAGADAAGEP